MVDQFSSLAAILLAISLATERLITMCKTIWPESLGEAKVDQNGVVSDVRDRGRKLGVQALSFLFAWITSSFLTGAKGIDPLGWIHVGTGDDALEINVIVVALLSMGGSAFWNNILGYTKAVKDIKKDYPQQAGSELRGDTAWKNRRLRVDPTPVLSKIRAAGSPNLKNLTKARI